MPLLGRYKSASGAASTNTSNTSTTTNPPAANQTSSGQQQQQRRPQLCESPLFGIRRQLPMGDAASSSSSSSGSSNNKQVSQAVVVDETQPLSSVPQQITRQQINYAFAIMDTNKDGMIDLRDLSQMLANLGVPIDEAILSHIMSSVSKRGDHRISEAEFLDWISLFIQVSDSPAAGASAPSSNRQRGEQEPAKGPRRRLTGLAGSTPAASGRASGRVLRSSTASSSLVAQPDDPVPARNRRGSGSGLALMRSLSSGPGSPSSAEPTPAPTETTKATSPGSSRKPPEVSGAADLEAQNDLRAAFGVFDLDGDGFITIDEVRAGLKLLGESWSPAELQQLFSKCTSTGSSGASSARSRSTSSSARDLSNQRISIDEFVRLLL